MLQKLGAQIAACYERAADCGRRAGGTTDPKGKEELLSLETSWTHLARSYESVESLERFLLSAHESRIEKWNTMIQRSPTEAKTLGNMKCDACDVAMKLFGIESHTILDQTDLRTYVCPRCDKVQTEAVSAFPNKVPTMEDQMVQPVDALLQSNAFDAETTRLLGSTFDAAWEAIVASGSPLTDPQHVNVLRELLAKLLIEMVMHGERNPDRLIENALGRSVLSPPANAELAAPQAGVSANVIRSS
jgi:hypothetical protein